MMLEQRVPFSLIFLVAGLGACAPFAIDTYLSSMPRIAESFHTDLSNIAITVSLFIFGMSVGQLIGGSLSDKVGRLSVILLGLSMFIVASIMLMLAGSLNTFLIWRIIQSLGSGMAGICGPALIRDHVDGKASAKVFSLVALVTMLAPAIAPAVGTGIIQFAPWQAIFGFLALLGCVLLFFSLKTLNFEKPKHTASLNHKTRVMDIITNKRSALFLIIQSCTFCVIMIFLTNASFMYQEYFQTTEELFTMLVIANVIGVMIINRLSSFMLNHYAPEKLLSFFLFLQYICVLVVMYGVLFDSENFVLIATALVLMMSASGGIGPNCTALFMRDYAHCAGLAASLLFSLQSITAAIVSAFVAKLASTSLLPLALAFVCVVSSGLICSILVKKIK